MEELWLMNCIILQGHRESSDIQPGVKKSNDSEEKNKK
jgi:hypothetical protein